MELLIDSVKTGCAAHVDAALQRCPRDVNKCTSAEVYPLHLAVWRNHQGIIERLLQAGANPDIRDGESGWTSLHRALYWGNIAAAVCLLRSGAATDLVDHQGRTPVDLVSRELLQPSRWAIDDSNQASAGQSSKATNTNSLGRFATQLYCWGSGANYQLGTGSTEMHEVPVRVDELRGVTLVSLSAGKFHSAALAADGQLFTWGFGRGGRLGHSEHHIHSGQSALIQPRCVEGLGRRRVHAVASGKHHMVAITESGEVWTWGSGRDGKLGYPAADSQPTPRKVAAFRTRDHAVAVAASNRHSAVVLSNGEVYTWGANREGQLGYGTVDSQSSPTPRTVESLKAKAVVSVSAAKHHTVVLTAEGDVYTWGHRVVVPRKVTLAGSCDVARAASGSGSKEDIRFHKGQADVSRPLAAIIAAGALHTSVLTRTGTVLTWRSADPQLAVREVGGALAGKVVVSVSAGKSRTACVTEEGDVYVWEARPVCTDGPSGSRCMQSLATPPTSTGQTAPPACGGVEGGERQPLEWRGGGGEDKAQQQPSIRRGGSSIRAGDEGAAQGVAGLSGSAGSAAIASASTGGATGGGGALNEGQVLPVRVPGAKRISQVAVGEKHSLALQSWFVPPLPDLLNPAASTHAAAGSRPRGHTYQAGEPSSRRSVGSDSIGSDDELSPARGDGSGQASARGQKQRQGGLNWSAVADAAVVGHSGAADSNRREETGHVLGPGDQQYSGDSATGIIREVESLQVLCQRCVAVDLVEPRSALAILEYADVAGAHLLRGYCLAVALRNLDALLLEARGTLETLPPHLASELEHSYKLAFAAAGPPGSPRSLGQRQQAAVSALLMSSSPPTGGDPAGLAAGEEVRAQTERRRAALLPRLQGGRHPTAAADWLGGQTAVQRTLPQVGSALVHAAQAALDAIGHSSAAATTLAGTFSAAASSTGSCAPGTTRAVGAVMAGAGISSQNPFQADRGALAAAEEVAAKLLRSCKRKLQQIEALEQQQAAGRTLDSQQLAKAGQRAVLTEAMQALEAGAPAEQVQRLLTHAQAVADQLATEPTATKSNRPLQQPPRPGQHNRNVSRAQPSISTSSSVNTAAVPAELVMLEPQLLQRVATAAAALHTEPPSSMSAPAAHEGASSSSDLAAMAPASGSLKVSKKHSTSAERLDKAARRRGGLSEFLAGELDKRPVQPPAAPAVSVLKGPAWGGAARSGCVPIAASLRGLLAAGSTSAVAAGSPAGLPSTPLTNHRDAIASSVSPAAASFSGATPSAAATPSPTATAPVQTPSRPTSLPAPSPAAPSPPLASFQPHTSPQPLLPGSHQEHGSRLSLADFMGRRSAPVAVGQRGPIAAAAAGGTSLPAAVHVPVWGGVKGSSPPVPSSSLASLKNIQAEQEQWRASTGWKGSTPAGAMSAAGSLDARVATPSPSLPSSSSAGIGNRTVRGGPSAFPVTPVAAAKDASGSAGAAGAGSSASAFHLPGTSPSSNSGGLFGSSPPGRTLLASSPGHSKWYIPDSMQERAQHIKAIQTEESAIKELSKLYGDGYTIRVVKPSGALPRAK